MKNSRKNTLPSYKLNQQGDFIIKNYNTAKPFASFFPGIAGKCGIPMWAFYVNRGQCISSFGIKDKDHSILEYFPANKAWQAAPLQGFRTFLKIGAKGNKPDYFYEPFSQHNSGVSSRMRITPYELTLEEDNPDLGLNICVEYFTIPNENYAGLARIVRIKNITKNAKRLQVIDGLPQIVPFGTNNFFLKKMSRTIEAWMTVENLDKGIPFYKLSVDPADRPEVVHIDAGNFYAPFTYKNGAPFLLRTIVDPEALFGHISDYSSPLRFIEQKKFTVPQKQASRNKTPSAFCYHHADLDNSQELVLYSIFGNMRDKTKLNEKTPRMISNGYLEGKRRENKDLISGLTKDIRTDSASREFNLYAEQTYLDNIMRGGYPLVMKAGGEKAVFYLYSRKHGDLERDYNRFQIQPTYYSQGNGNYRDVNQNRRCDVWFNPQVGEENIFAFFNLIQSDGFNPLIVKGVSFILNDPQGLKTALYDKISADKSEALLGFLNKPFNPGELLFFMEEQGIQSTASRDELLAHILSYSSSVYEAEHGEGFWTDHWAYNLDLLESYLAIYPEGAKKLIFEDRTFTFFDNAETVRPRSEKYMLYNDKPRQLHSVSLDNEKKELLNSRKESPSLSRTQHGKGEIYRSTLCNKLLCLLVNKISSLDPNGCGIEMEANKPNWFDALNGLPALFGSSSCETFELKRLIIFLKKTFQETETRETQISEEITAFMRRLSNLLKEWAASNDNKKKDFNYWDASAAIKEEYRRSTRMGFSGKEETINSQEMAGFLEEALKKCENAIDKSFDKTTNVYYSYFINEVTEYESHNGKHIKALSFSQKKLPLFLEGQMHALRISENQQSAEQLCEAVRSSALYDAKLKMYKVTESLLSMPEEIGRCRVFTPGWLENESIWLHMEYKYLLEILRCGLYKRFYAEFKNLLIPYQEPKRYGRNILENSSFLASSAFPEEKLHGNGFVARLSGSTAEFIHIWTIMNAGSKPFAIDHNNTLTLRLSPVLAAWLFKPLRDKNPDYLPEHNHDYTYGFRFLGNTWIVYHNPKRKDTFGEKAVRPSLIFLRDKNSTITKVDSGIIPAPYAEEIRDGKIERIDIFLS